MKGILDKVLGDCEHQLAHAGGRVAQASAKEAESSVGTLFSKQHNNAGKQASKGGAGQKQVQQPKERWKGDLENYKGEFFPNNPSKLEKKHFEGRGNLLINKKDGTVWSKDTSKHGGYQWKMWKNIKSKESGDKHASIWPDGRVRYYGDQ